MYLFKEIEGFAMHTMVRAIQGDPVELEKGSGKKLKNTKPMVGTHINFQDVKFENGEPSSLVKLEEDKLYTSFDDIKVEPVKVENCPNFIFMPSKV